MIDGTPTPTPSFHVRSSKISDDQKARVIASVRIVPNFPKPGLDFKDLSMLVGDPDAFQLCIDVIVKRYLNKGITGDARKLSPHPSQHAIGHRHCL